MGGSGVGRTSGEYIVPVTQATFDGFAGEVRTFISEQREDNNVIRSLLSDGAATMAVLRSDSATFLKRSDEASSKIRLLAEREAVRADREKRAETRQQPAFTTPSAPPPPPPEQSGFWADAWLDLRKKAIGLVALGALLIAYDQVRIFIINHPSIAADGEGFTNAQKHEHDRGREPVVPLPAPASIPASTPPAPTRSP